MNWKKFPYPLIVTTIYAAIGMFSDIWDKTSVIFMTIPIYYLLVSALTADRKDKKMLTQIKINYLRIALRNRRFLFFSLTLPIIFYLLFTKVMTASIPADYLKTWQLNYMVAMAVYSSLIACVASGSTVLTEDREKRFTLFVQLTGSGRARYYLGMVAVFLPMSIVSLVILGVIAMAVNQVALTPVIWLVLVILLPICSLPFLLIGILISLAGNTATVNIIGQLLMFGMAILGGLWWPIELLPKALQGFGKLLPTYQIVTLLQGVIHKTVLSAGNVIGLLLWTVGLLAVIALLMRRQRLHEVTTI